MKLAIHRPGRDAQVFEIEDGVYRIGRDEDCQIRLAHPSVEPRHAILSLREDDIWVEDLASEAGTCINGQRVSGRTRIVPGSAIAIAEFTLVPGEPPTAPAAEAQPVRSPVPTPSPQPPPPAPPASETPLLRSIRQQIHRELLERLDIKRLSASRPDASDLRSRVTATVEAIVQDVRDRLPPDVDRADLVRRVLNEALGLGPLEDLLADESITEIMVNGPNRVYVERAGRLEPTGLTFMDDASVLAVIERIVAPLGRRIDESQPYVDARLADGSRVNAIIHPLSLVGPCLTIRKFSKVPLTDQDLVRFGSMPVEYAGFLQTCVRMRKNIVVSGGTGSGKTSLLNVLSSYLPAGERIVTIEDAAELKLSQDHVIRLEARPPNIEGRGAVTIRDLVRNALRMRPDRIVVGECRGGEALDMLQAMNTGHDGSLTTVHANSPRDVISRLETMVLMSGMELPVRAIREQLASALDLVVHIARFSDGTRKVARISEIVGLEGDQITMQDIFAFDQTGLDPEGRVQGRFKATGSVPTFLEDIAARGLQIDRAVFDPRHAFTPGAPA